MTCPHCQNLLSTIEIETSDGRPASIEECLSCGGHLLPTFLANFITTNSAKNIDSIIPKLTAIPSSSPICPQCGQTMSSIKDDSIPETVTVFTCPNRHGDFFPKDQLLNFKRAQDAKLNYHKLWGIPLKSAFAVLIPVMFIFTAIAVLPTAIKQMSISQENRIKASEILTNPLITPISPTQVLISFTTRNSVKTSIRFTEGLDTTYSVSDTEQTNHLLNVQGLSSGTLYKYVIILETLGKQVETSEYTFSTP